MSSESRSLHRDDARLTDRSHFVDPDSVFRNVNEILGRKWHLRIVYHLLTDGPMGFSALKGSLKGISSKMLSESLSSLEDRELVAREIVSDQPVRVEYSLTERGRALEPILDEIVRWDAEHGPVTESG
ncbi:winged helix-turn-helix transcriptional regulator [Halomicrobium katesii]|uniref:winged helix-turn-helix transcriptional regulator n=1 Tax=Halomicrobium katesii TaxID=437163 RepID=UPI000378DB90|nr:helix-turn-helix domain-containing protein [Halomicrobium katesii]